MHTDEQIQKLIKAALKYAALPDGKVNHSDYLRLCKCVEPFREQRPRVGRHLADITKANTVCYQCVELTDAVKKRLSSTGGVSKQDVMNVLLLPKSRSISNLGLQDAIMRLIEDAGVDYD